LGLNRSQVLSLARLLHSGVNVLQCLGDPCSCATDVLPNRDMHELWMHITGLLIQPFGIAKASSEYCHSSRYNSTRAHFDDHVHIYVSQDVKHELPFLLSQSAVLSYRSGSDQRTNPLVAFPIERSPLYSGIPVAYSGDSVHLEAYSGIGGIFVEPFAFSAAPLHAAANSAQVEPQRSQVGALTEWQAVTTAAGAAWQVRPRLDNLSARYGCTAEFLERLTPHERLWSPLDVDAAGIPTGRELPVGDAGIYDDLGHLPLLRRGVSKLVVFDSAARDANKNVTVESNVYLKAAFGAAGGLEPPNPRGSPNPMMAEDYLTVFEPSEFAPLWHEVQAQHSRGEPAVVRGRYTVVDNKHFGIKGGWQADIVWVVFLPSETFRAALPSEIRKGMPAYFPNVASSEPTSKFELSLLSQYASWVTEHKVTSEVRAMLETRAHSNIVSV